MTAWQKHFKLISIQDIFPFENNRIKHNRPEHVSFTLCMDRNKLDITNKMIISEF